MGSDHWNDACCYHGTPLSQGCSQCPGTARIVRTDHTTEHEATIATLRADLAAMEQRAAMLEKALLEVIDLPGKAILHNDPFGRGFQSGLIGAANVAKRGLLK